MISGVGLVGAQLTGSTGAWSGPLTGITLRWERCTKLGRSCKTVGAGSRYRVARADRGRALRIIARAVGEDGISVDAPSHLVVIRR